MEPNPRDFYVSLATEVSACANRVRSLIGDAHFLSDGHHKEYALRSLLSRYLPAGMRIGSGFSVAGAHLERRSREQDILVTDCHAMVPLLDANGLLVVQGSAVSGAVSVKTTASQKEVRSTISGLESVLPTLPAGAFGDTTQVPFLGGYFFSARTNEASTVANRFKNAFSRLDSDKELLRIGLSTTWAFVIEDRWLVCVHANHDRDIGIVVYDSGAMSLPTWLAIILEHLIESRAEHRGADQLPYLALEDLDVAHKTIMPVR